MIIAFRVIKNDLNPWNRKKVSFHATSYIIFLLQLSLFYTVIKHLFGLKKNFLNTQMYKIKIKIYIKILKLPQTNGIKSADDQTVRHYYP